MSALRPMERLRVAPTSVGANVRVSVDGATGSPDVRIPLPLTAGRDGFGPSLSLVFGGYDPLSPFAHGWSLSGLASVEVDTRDGLPAYDGRETFRYAGQELVPLEGGTGPTSPWSRTIDTVDYAVRAFRLRMESSPIRVEQWTAANGRMHWRVRQGDGSVHVLGLRADDSTRLADPRPPFAYRSFRWLIEAAFDRLGNAMVVEYLPEDAVGLDALSVEATRFASATVNRYVKRIGYGNAAPLSEASSASDLESASWHFEAVLDYGDHDPTSPTTTRSQPWGLREDIGHSGRMGFEVRTRRLCRRVLMFHHFETELEEAETLVGALELALDEAPDASTLTGVRFVGYRTEDSGRVSLATPWATVSYTESVGDESFALCRVSLLRGQSQLIDFYGEGLPGLLTTTAAGTYYARNFGDGELGAHRPIPSWPRGFDGALQDFDRDGNVELFQPTGPDAGYWRFDRREKRWRSLKRFEKAPSATENVTLADMSGDGRPDVVLFTQSGITWWPNRGEEGFGEPVRVRAEVERMPHPNMRLGRFMADMTGDGLADIVEVRNGSVHYWPNLGRGRFGERVVMASAPRLADEGTYDPARILLVDLGQSGTADLVYVSSSGVFRATNNRGASFGAYERIASAPRIPNGAQIQLADFYGDGSNCLVVTTTTAAGDSAFHVLRLSRSPGAKQVLSVTSPLGALTELEWGHSARHYLRDLADGRGWESPLPAQHPVVDAVHRSEPIDGASMSERFHYHDGHYDPRLRSFALFAVVDHIDVDVDQPFAGVTPLLSRRFLHTGEDDYLSRFAQYHYGGAGLLARPPPTGVLETATSLLTADYLEAWCALSGSPVREELFALDVNAVQATHPHRVRTSARSVSITRLAGDQYLRPGVRVVQRFTGTSEYEQVATNPRDSVGRVLTLDPYLVPTLTMQAGFPLTSGAVDPQQGRVLATAFTTDVVHFDTETRFELAVPVHARTFEVHVPVADALDTVFDDGLASTLADAIADASAYDEPLDPDGDDLAARAITHSRTSYWNTARDAALSLGTVLEDADDVVLAHHTEQAAYDRGQLSAVFDTRVDPDTDLASLGYVEGTGDDADIYFAIGPTSSFGDASTFYRLEQLEAYDTGVRAIGSDPHHLVTASMTDQVDNETTADIDYHLLAPFRLTDPNGTAQEIDYDPLGVARRTSRYGHALDVDGTTLVDHGFTALTFGDALPSIDDALDDPETALGEAETLLVYEFSTGGAPMRVLTLKAEQFVHRGPDAGDADARAQVSLSYSDGFGRALQSRLLVEPGVDDIVGGDADPRWRVTGYIAFDAKGQARQQYEPFLRGDHVFEPALDHRQFGVATTTTFDALGRPVRQDMPNDTFTETTFTAWSKQTLDPNDTSDRATAYVAARDSLDHDHPEYIALQQALLNQETPVTVHLDPLGRPIATTELIREESSGVTLTEIASLEIRGLSEKTTDRRDLAASTRSFDRLGRPLFETSMDAGERRTLYDAEGREVKHWREDTAEARTFDIAGRMTERHVTHDTTTWLAEEITYGEGAPDAADKNQLGRVILVKDAAGTVETSRYGAFGELLETERTLITDAGTDPDWDATPSLEASGFVSKAATDALGRPTHALLPDGTDRVFGYLRSGPLTTLEVTTPDTTTRNILVSTEYNARGQQVSRVLGNNVEVSNEYEIDTFRLYRRRADFDGTDTYQDLRHHYDPVGNLVHVDDLAQSPTADLVVDGLAVTAERVFQYDDRYQLIQASGRVHNALIRSDFRGDTPNDPSFRGTQRCDLNDGGAVQRYVRTYTYDHGGNLTGYTHDAEGPTPGATWTNAKWVSSTSNRQYFAKDLNDVTILDPGGFFDARGQVTSLPNVRAMTWSPRDQLRSVTLIERTGGDPNDDELYDYAADGKRIRKTTNRLVSGNVEKTETIYLDGCELRRVTQITPTPTSTVILERWSSHAEGEDGRIATLYRWETDTLGRETDDTSVVRTHFHVASNIGSVSLELDDAGGVLSYEEYFPYGGTALVAGDSVTDIAFRTLRFVGKDQDDSTGFYVFQFRYYAPFLGNWVSTDPAGEADGPNRYWYAHNNPVCQTDALGLDAGNPNQLFTSAAIESVDPTIESLDPTIMCAPEAGLATARESASAPATSQPRESHAPRASSTETARARSPEAAAGERLVGVPTPSPDAGPQPSPSSAAEVTTTPLEEAARQSLAPEHPLTSSSAPARSAQETLPPIQPPGGPDDPSDPASRTGEPPLAGLGLSIDPRLLLNPYTSIPIPSTQSELQGMLDGEQQALGEAAASLLNTYGLEPGQSIWAVEPVERRIIVDALASDGSYVITDPIPTQFADETSESDRMDRSRREQSHFPAVDWLGEERGWATVTPGVLTVGGDDVAGVDDSGAYWRSRGQAYARTMESLPYEVWASMHPDDAEGLENAEVLAVIQEHLDGGVATTADTAASVTSSGTTRAPARAPSLRLEYLGRTPGRSSRTGRQVEARMRAERRVRDGAEGVEYRASDGNWYPVRTADMSHLTDAVRWWNSTGRYLGARSEAVREWMLDPESYEFDHFSLNRSAGARLGIRYLPPVSPLLRRPMGEVEPPVIP